ncbi:membrane protein [Actinomadura cremea]|nr:membrane protein [Actinomadura cremea]
MSQEHRLAPLRRGGPAPQHHGAPRDRFAAARRLLSPLGVAVLAAGAVGYIAAVDPNAQGHYPTCPFLALSGYQCPGCGALRTVHAVAHGQLGEAVALNVFTVTMLPVLAFFWVRWAVARARDRPTRTKAADPRLIWAFFAVVIVFWVVRNLPFGAALAA